MVWREQFPRWRQTENCVKETRTYVHIHLYIYVHGCVHIHLYMHVYTYIHSLSVTHTHTHTLSRTPSLTNIHTHSLSHTHTHSHKKNNKFLTHTRGNGTHGKTTPTLTHTCMHKLIMGRVKSHSGYQPSSNRVNFLHRAITWVLEQSSDEDHRTRMLATLWPAWSFILSTAAQM